MSQYLLDTDICSYVIRQRPDALAGKFERHVHAIAVSVITAAELRFGAEKSGGRAVTALVEEFLSRIVTLDWTAKETFAYAKARAALEKRGTMIGAMDLLTAAHAISTDRILVTNNLREFQRVPNLQVEQW